MSNNTATPLISHGTFTGAYQKAAATSAVIQVNVFSDTSGILHIQQSANGFFTQNDLSFVYDTAGTAKIFETPLALANYRITYTNTSGRTQSYLYIQTIDRTIPATDIDIRLLSGQTDSALMFAFDPQTGVKVPLHCDSSGNLGISANVSVSLDHTSDSVAVWGAEANGTQQILLTDASGRLLVVTDSGPGDVTNISGQVDVMNFPPPVTDVSASITNWLDASGLHVEVNNFPAFPTVQDISGDVRVMNLLDLSGLHVVIDNFPEPTAIQEVSGNVNVMNWGDASGLFVEITNFPAFPAVQDISGDVRVMNLLDLSGLHVVIDNFPEPTEIQEVSGNVNVMNWGDASGLFVEITNFPAFPAVQDISGDVRVMNLLDLSGLHVTIDNFPEPPGGVQEISGNVAVMNWGDASGLYVTVTNPSSSVTADISGQTVVINANAYSSSMFLTGNVTQVQYNQIYGTITGNPANDTRFLTDVTAGDKFYIYKDYQLLFLGTVQIVFTNYQLQLVDLDNGIFVGSFPYTNQLQYTKQVPSLDFDNNTLVNITNKVLTTTGTITGQVDALCTVTNFPAPVVDVSATIVNWLDASGLHVEVNNFPAFPTVQDISGDVRVMNLLDLSGLHVVIDNFPEPTEIQEVSGNVNVMNWGDASGLYVEITNFPAFPTVQDISGDVRVMNLLDLSGLHVVIDNFPEPTEIQEVSGNVNVMNWGDASGLFVEITNFPAFPTVQDISGDVRVMNLLDLSGLHVVIDNFPEPTEIQEVSGNVNVMNWGDASGLFVEITNFPAFPAVQDISGTITEVNSADILTEVTSINGKITTCNTSDISGTVFISNFPAPATDISATILNFPSVQDISGSVITSATNSSMTMYGSGYEPNSFLSGVAKITNTDVSGIATQFLSQVAEGDNFWIVNENERAVFIGVVATIQSNTQLTLVASAGLTYSFTYYRIVVNLVEANVPLQLNPVGDSLRTYVAGGFITESNSADILTEVTSINGKITTCDTSDISGTVFISNFPASTTDISATILNFPSVQDISGSVITKAIDNAGISRTLKCDPTGILNVSGTIGLKAAFSSTNGNLVNLFTDSNSRLVCSAMTQALDSTNTARTLLCDASGTRGILNVNNYPQGTTNVSGSVLLATGTNSIGTVGLNTGTNSIGKVGLNAGTESIGTVNISGQTVITSATSSSMAMYASGLESYTPLEGSLIYITGVDISGVGTLFSSELTNGDEFWVIANGSPLLWGEIASVQNDFGATLVSSRGSYAPALGDEVFLVKNAVVANKPVKLDFDDNLLVNVVSGSVNITNTIETIKTVADISGGTAITVSSTPIRLTSWTPSNQGGSGTIAFYKFYNKVGATSSDTPVFTYPVTSSANNTIAPIRFYNYTFDTALSVRATAGFDASNTTAPTGRQISNFFYS